MVRQCALAVRILHPGEDAPPVLLASSTTGRGVDELWAALEAAITHRRGDGTLTAMRAQQATRWLDESVREALLGWFLNGPDVAAKLSEARQLVADGKLLPTVAARRLLAARG